MKNPKRVAVITGLVSLYFVYRIFGATEAPGAAVSAMYWVFLLFAVVGCIGSIIQIAKGE